MDDPLPPDPFALFGDWFAAAKDSEPSYPESFALATVDRRGRPGVRTVLMKAWDERGIVFYTNAEGAKGTALDQSREAEALFYWKSAQRQVRIGGTVERVSATEADAYFATRPRDSRLGAWASLQSRPMPERGALAPRLARYAERFPGDVRRPPHWPGYRILPDRFEFWEERQFRHHERWTYDLLPGAGWARAYLYP